MSTLSFVDKSAESVITNYLVYLIREERVKQICFILAQYIAESCLIFKNLGDIIKLLASIQKK